MLGEVTVTAPGVGPGWRRLATVVAEAVSLEGLEGLWVFRPLRLDKKEWGTVILALREEDRYRIVTAQYAHTIKGRERGAFATEIKEIGRGPVEALDALVAAVPKRTDEDPPVRIPVESWYPPEEEDGPAHDE
jgi:hypothetical protein